MLCPCVYMQSVASRSTVSIFFRYTRTSKSDDSGENIMELGWVYIDNLIGNDIYKVGTKTIMYKENTFHISLDYLFSHLHSVRL